MKIKKRRSIQKGNFIQGFLFFIGTIFSIICLIAYLWIFKEIDESLLAIEIQKATSRDLRNEIDEMKNLIEGLSRSDLITTKARNELGMVPAKPETLIIAISDRLGKDL